MKPIDDGAEMERRAVLTLAADLTDLYGKPTGGTTSEARARYAAALLRLAAFVERLKVPASAFKDIEALARLFSDLERGTISPLFQEPSRHGRRVDPAELWFIRADVALGFHCFLTASAAPAGTRAATAERLSKKYKKYKSLARLLRKRSTIEACIPNWHASLAKDAKRLMRGEETKIPKDAVQSFQTQLAVIGAGVADIKALGEKLLAQANARAENLPKWYRAS